MIYFLKIFTIYTCNYITTIAWI